MQDWNLAGLRQPSAFRSYFNMVESAGLLIVGKLSDRDWEAVRHGLRWRSTYRCEVTEFVWAIERAMVLVAGVVGRYAESGARVVKKDEVQALLDAMPNEIDAEQLIYTLYLKHKLERAEADIAAGRVTPHEEAERLMAEWLK